MYSSTLYSCQSLLKLEFARQIFEKYSNIKFHENPPSGTRVVPCGEMDRHDEANSRYSQFCERAQKEAKCHFSITFRAKEKLFLRYRPEGQRERAARSQT